MSLLVLYRVESVCNGEWWSEDSYNAFEAPIGDSQHNVLLGDLLQYILDTASLRDSLGTKYAFFAEIFGKLVYLAGPSSVLPVLANNTVRLRLRPSAVSPTSNIPELQPAMMASSLKNLREENIASVAGSAAGQSREPRYTDSSTSRPQHAPNNKQRPEPSSSSTAQHNGNQLESGLNTIVGEDAAAALSDAAEVAKEAARSLFTFASAWGKTVLEAAASVGSASSSRLSGPLTLSKTKVQVVRELSEGGFGIVYLAQDNVSGRNYALKQLLCQDRAQFEEARAEIDNLQLIQGHPNVIELVDHAMIPGASSKQFFMLFPLYPAGTAWDAIERAGNAGPPWPFPEARALRVTLCAAKALAHVHSRGLTHRDVKPHNILLSTDSVDDSDHVLMDFGSVAPAQVVIRTRADALAVEDEASTKTSMAFRPPELFTVPFPPCTIDERVDVWSLGCTLYCLAFGRSPFESAKDGVQKLAIVNGRWSAPTDRRHRECVYSAAFLKLVDDMLQVDWTHRLCMPDVVKRLQSMV